MRTATYEIPPQEVGLIFCCCDRDEDHDDNFDECYGDDSHVLMLSLMMVNMKMMLVRIIYRLGKKSDDDGDDGDGDEG